MKGIKKPSGPLERKNMRKQASEVKRSQNPIFLINGDKFSFKT